MSSNDAEDKSIDSEHTIVYKQYEVGSKRCRNVVTLLRLDLNSSSSCHILTVSKGIVIGSINSSIRFGKND